MSNTKDKKEVQQYITNKHSEKTLEMLLGILADFKDKNNENYSLAINHVKNMELEYLDFIK